MNEADPLGIVECQYPLLTASQLDHEAPEPRYVSPTRRDQIRRIWAPVMINGHGPFRLVLDTGASHSAVTALVALALGIPTDQSPPVLLHGVTGFATVPTIRVDTLTVGDLSVDSPTLPIVPDALGGAQGIRSQCDRPPNEEAQAPKSVLAADGFGRPGQSAYGASGRAATQPVAMNHGLANPGLP